MTTPITSDHAYYNKKYGDMSRSYIEAPSGQVQSDMAERSSDRQIPETRRSIALESFTQIGGGSIEDVETDGADFSAESFLTDYVQVSSTDVHDGIQTEFEELQIKESGIRRVWCHKGLVTCLLFAALFIAGVVVVETQLPDEGFRSALSHTENLTKCEEKIPLCFVFRVIRSVGMMGLLGGVANWIFILLLFWRVPFLIGSGVFQTHHTEVIDGLRHIVIEVLFDEQKLQNYVRSTNKNIQKALQLNQHFESLLESSATDRIIELKIDKLLAGPHGVLLTSMSTDSDEVRRVVKGHVNCLINKLSKIIHEKLRIPGITDGGLKAEISRILEPRLDKMEPTDINKVMKLMIRKHMSWLIVWGSVFGTMIAILNEIVFIVIVKLKYCNKL